jgi:hypothetical protein
MSPATYSDWPNKIDQEFFASKSQASYSKTKRKMSENSESIVKDEQVSVDEYSKKTFKELVQICKEKEIKYSGKKKKDLIKLLEEAKSKSDSVDLLESKMGSLKLESKDKTIIEDIIEAIKKKAETMPDIILLKEKEVILVKEKEVIQWMYGDLSFLPPIEKGEMDAKAFNKALKDQEDEWGRQILNKKRPDIFEKKKEKKKKEETEETDLKLTGTWTATLGEHIIKELYSLLGENVTTPDEKNNHRPDWEIKDYIIEVKSETYRTSGTAGEKILGAPYKYASVPRLYGKPMKIICLGGAEKACIEEYGNLGSDDNPKRTPEKKKFLKFYKEMQIEYVSATSLLHALL